jgi:membrane fusion protein, heavy metal efflux system
MKNNIVLAIFSVILISCNSHEVNIENPSRIAEPNTLTLTEAQINMAGITFGKVEQKQISKRLTLNGKIDVPPQNLISVSMPLGGFLKSTHLLPGMHVKKGELLATLQDQQYIQLQQDYLMAKSKMVFLDTELKRQKELNQSKSSSDKVLQQTEMDHSSAKVTLKALAEKLRLLNIRPETLNEENLSSSVYLYSSIDGFVSKVNVNIGKYLNPTDVLFELINPADIHLNLKVFEKDLEYLTIGQNVLAYTNNQANKKYPCKIILISQNLNSDRSAEVHCHFDDYHKSLFPGMYMNAEVDILNQNVTAVLEKAIVSYEGKAFVFAVKGKGHFELLEVKQGFAEGGYVAIEGVGNSDLKNLNLVMDGAYALLMQLKNKPEEE